MTNMEMKELETVSGGDAGFHEMTRIRAQKNRERNALINKPTTTFVCEYDKEDMEYLEDILDPEDLYEYFAV